MRKLAAFLLSLGLALGIGLTATPAQAARQGCPDQSICLYQNIGFAGQRWQTSITNVYYHTNNCLNIAPAQWSNGTPVGDNSAGLVVDNAVETSPWIHYNIYVHQWSNCNPDGGVKVFTGSAYEWGNLNNYFYTGTTYTMYHSISSLELIVKGSALDLLRQSQLTK